ncbi:MAG: acyl-CoA dehydrogenase family protein [Polyangiales bacterium]
MNLDLNDAQRALRDRARDFAAARLAPHADAFERDERIPRDVLSDMAALGLMGVNLPSDLGGAGAGVVAYACAMREVARGCASTAVTMAVTNMVGEVIERFGTDAQRARYVPRLARGEYAAGAFALSEPEAGSDPGAMRTTATREGGQWVLRGAKQWISSGPIAGVFVVWARTGGPGTAGISCFLVEAGTPGLRVGRHEDKMGLRASFTVPLEFDDVRVPEDALLGVEGGGFRIAMMALDGGRVGIASQAVGIATAALDVGFDALARGALRGEGARRALSDAAAEVRAAWLLALRAAWRKERGLTFSQEASVAKLYASECAWRTCNRVSDAVGPAASTEALTLQRHLRDSRVTMIYEGTSEIQRLVIARSLLKG